MLPTYAPRHRPFRSRSSTHKISWIDSLSTRTRLTNLGLGLLLALTTISLIFNLRAYLSSSSSISNTITSYSTSPRVLDTVTRGNLRKLNHLIMVPGHAIWKGTDAALRLDDEQWILEPYQKGGGLVAAFFSHISQAVDLLADQRALLVFSGGQTRASSTTTEAESYLRLALSADLLLTAATRATTEEHALDSYQNLLFSIARFHEYTGNYPSKITVVGYEMKKKRFTELHRKAIRWPQNRFQYVGIDPVGDEGSQAQLGEQQNGYTPYSKDLYGCHSMLAQKRRGRDMFFRFHSYYSSSPELEGLLDWCPDQDPTAVYPGPLPWDVL